MIKRHFKWIVLFISFCLGGLIAIQAYWINYTFHLKKQEIHRNIMESMKAVSKTVEENAYCFRFRAKSYIRPGEGIYVVKQKHTNEVFVPSDKNSVDSLELFNVFYMQDDTVFYNAKSILFNNPAVVDIDMKFEYQFADSSRLKSDQQFNPDIKDFTFFNYLDKLGDKRTIEEIISMEAVDTMLRNDLMKIGARDQFEFGIKQETADTFLYLKPGSETSHLVESDLSVPFLRQHKLKDAYTLVVFIPDSFQSIISSMWLMMITSALIILILILAFAYFIQTILRQKKLSQMKNDFINNITHEFKTPITNISLALENMSENQQQADRYLQIIGAENEHMRENTERILQIALLDKDEIRLNKTNVNLHELIQRIAKSFDLQLANVKGRIEFYLEADKHHLFADETHLMNVFNNIIDNAIKYRRDDPAIVIVTKSINHSIRITITDNGIGMSEEVCKHIFDRFFRGSSGDVHDVKGFGLGLNYTQKIIELHGGTIEVKSTPNKGSTFDIILPL